MMDRCWGTDPDIRATFSQLKNIMDSFLPEYHESAPVDLDYELQQQARGIIYSGIIYR